MRPDGQIDLEPGGIPLSIRVELLDALGIPFRGLAGMVLSNRLFLMTHFAVHSAVTAAEWN